MRKTSPHRLSLIAAPLLLTFALIIPVAAHAQSWAAGVHPLAEVPHGSASQAITDMYFEEGKSSSSSLGPISLTPSYSTKVLDGTSVYYNADTGSHGRIDNIGSGRALITETGPMPWGDGRAIPESSLTLINTAPNGDVSWTKILD